MLANQFQSAQTQPTTGLNHLRRSEEMMNSTKHGLMFITACLMFIFLNGCALTKETVSLSYVPQTDVTKLEGADAVTVSVEVKDVRTMKDKVSVKKNGYGMEMAAIIAKEDVAETLRKAVEAELVNRGFVLATGGISVISELSKFYNDFKVGFWSGTAVAEVTMNVQIRKADGTIGFSKLVTGEGTKENLQLASGSNARDALDAALKDAVTDLFNDTMFINALFEAGKS
jgi:uncharacterized lipoprotein